VITKAVAGAGDRKRGSNGMCLVQWLLEAQFCGEGSVVQDCGIGTLLLGGVTFRPFRSILESNMSLAGNSSASSPSPFSESRISRLSEQKWPETSGPCETTTTAQQPSIWRNLYLLRSLPRSYMWSSPVDRVSLTCEKVSGDGVGGVKAQA
jgi:hypothetical protein